MSEPLQHLRVRKIAKRNLERFDRLIAASPRRYRDFNKPIVYENSDGARCGIGIAMKRSTLSALSERNQMYGTINVLQEEGIVAFDSLMLAELIQVAHDYYAERKRWDQVALDLMRSLDHYPLPIKYFFERRGFDNITKRSYKKLMRIIRRVT